MRAPSSFCGVDYLGWFFVFFGQAYGACVLAAPHDTRWRWQSIRIVWRRSAAAYMSKYFMNQKQIKVRRVVVVTYCLLLSKEVPERSSSKYLMAGGKGKGDS